MSSKSPPYAPAPPATTATAASVVVAVLAATVLTGCTGPDGGGGTDTARPAPPPRASPATPGPSRTPAGAPWRPRPGLAWQWQLDGRADPSAEVPVYDIDGFENTAADVARLHRDGRKVFCDINVGAGGGFRPERD
ncbi:endo alpha-1,4 polygalactosaminidase, partial [Streptomyces prasinus]|uniref:endo alpha-1,4 polygalactosaminidase n=1 Tax=Streptomyces prasinus TaxID=67345 RepID=UPI00363223D6